MTTRKKISNVLWGLIWIALGIAIALSVFGYIEFWPFLSLWWPLLIIIPSLISFFTNGFRGGSLVWLTIGVMLLLYSLDIITGSLLRKLIVPVILILIGLTMILRNLFAKSHSEHFVQLDNAPEYVAAFATKTDIVASENFAGAKTEAIFGTQTLDLRGAELPHDVAIDANATFGQVNILVPDAVNVKAYSTGIFGGTSNDVKNNENAVSTVYVDATSVFGGVSIR